MFLWFQSWDFEYINANSDTIKGRIHCETVYHNIKFQLNCFFLNFLENVSEILFQKKPPHASLVLLF